MEQVHWYCCGLLQEGAPFDPHPYFQVPTLEHLLSVWGSLSGGGVVKQLNCAAMTLLLWIFHQFGPCARWPKQ